MTTFMQMDVDTLKARFTIFSSSHKDGDSLFSQEDGYDVDA